MKQSEIELAAIDRKTEIDKAEKLLDAHAPKDGVVVYKLIRPVTVNGTNYTELTLDFNSITGADLEAIEMAVLMKNEILSPMREFSKTYQLHLAARAAKININDIRSFPIKDATALSLMAQNFLLNQG